MLREPRVRIRAGLEQRCHQLQIGRLLTELCRRLRIQRLRGPLDIDRRVERCRPGIAREFRVRAALEQELGEIEVAVDRGHEQRTRMIASAHLIDVGARFEQSAHRLCIPLAHGEQQCTESAFITDQISVRRSAIAAPTAGRVGWQR
jgi:hypothetical protein